MPKHPWETNSFEKQGRKQQTKAHLWPEYYYDLPTTSAPPKVLKYYSSTNSVHNRLLAHFRTRELLTANSIMSNNNCKVWWASKCSKKEEEGGEVILEHMSIGRTAQTKAKLLRKGSKKEAGSTEVCCMCIMKSLVHRKSSAKNKEVSPNRQYSWQ
jgi:hypothetical protein